jgi:hypothetical protein
VDALNADAERYGFEVRFLAQTSWIEITGDDIEEAASDPTTLVGWFLRRAIGAGYVEGKEQTHRKANSERRKYLRRHAKTKAGMAEAAKIEAEASRRAAFIRDVAIAHGRFYEMLKDLPPHERDRLDLDPEEHRLARVPLTQRTNYRDKEEPEGDTGWQKTTGDKKRPNRS